jgi:hypothetical protein
MTKHVDILFACPPSVDFPTLVAAEDNSGNKLAVGQWIAPSNDDPFWRFRLSVAELVVMLVAPEQQAIMEAIVETIDSSVPARTPVLTANQLQQQRAARRAQLAGVKRRTAVTAPPSAPAIPPQLAEKCPSCGETFDKSKDELVSCVKCGEDKCTARCVTNLLQPCADCAAGVPDSDEGGFDPSAVPDDAPGLREAIKRDHAEGVGNAAAARVFDNKIGAKAGSADEGADDDE